MRRVKILTLMALTFLLAAPVWAQTAPNTAPATEQNVAIPVPVPASADKNAQPPTMLSLLNKIGMQVTPLPPMHELPVWSAEKDGQKAVLMALPNTNNMLLGNVFDAEGNNVTAAYLASLSGAPASATAQPAVHKTSEIPAAFKVLAALNTIDSGQGSRPVYLFLDPLCAPCRQIYQQITAQQSAQPNRVQLHVVPVGILSKDSADIAAGLWSQADHAAALQKMVELAADKSKAAELDTLHGGWILQTRDEARQAIAKNNQFLQSRKLNSAPVLFWLDDQNKPKMIKGMPNDFGTVLQHLFSNNPAP